MIFNAGAITTRNLYINTQRSSHVEAILVLEQREWCRSTIYRVIYAQTILTLVGVGSRAGRDVACSG